MNEPAILVIEDEPSARTLLRVTLEQEGYRCLHAADGLSGVEAALGREPAVVLLDLGLPDLDGVEVTRRIRARSAVPIIVVSARGQEEDKVAALDEGANDYVTKPFVVGELLARIRAARGPGHRPRALDLAEHRHRARRRADAEHEVVCGATDEVRAFLSDVPNDRIEKVFSNPNLRGIARRLVTLGQVQRALDRPNQG